MFRFGVNRRAKSSTSRPVDIRPHSYLYCTVIHGVPCQRCKELRDLQENIRATYADSSQENPEPDFWQEINRRNDSTNIFPFEIKAIIFEFVCEPRTENVKQQIKLLSVCKQWREVAINIPRLWTILPAPPISLDQFYIEQVEMWLQRTKQLPISLSFEYLAPFFDYGKSNERPDFTRLPTCLAAITDLIVANKHRIYALNPTALGDIPRRIMSGALQHSITAWPMLSRLTITDTLPIDEALGMLRCCPTLTYVEFNCLRGGIRMIPLFANSPHLKFLIIGFCPNSDPSDLLNHLSAPALEKLICHSDSGSSPILSLEIFLQHSGRSLHTLHVGHHSFNHDELISLLENQCSLRTLSIGWRVRLEVDWEDIHQTKHALDAIMHLLLTDTVGEEGVGRHFTTGTFLPHLETFKYTGPMSWSWNIVTDVYTSHANISEDGRPDQIDSSQILSNIGAPSTRYRPLHLLKLTIADDMFSARAVVNEVGSNRLRLLAARCSNFPENGCRFECELDHDFRRMCTSDHGGAWVN